MVTDDLQDRATRTHREHVDRLQMQAMAALQGIHEHPRAAKDEVPLLLTDVRPAVTGSSPARSGGRP